MKTPIRLAAVALFFLAACGLDVGETTDADGGTSSLSSCTDTWAGYGQGFFVSSCRTCHEHASQFGTQASVQAARSEISREISTGAMPEGSALSASAKARILAYLSCGAP